MTDKTKRLILLCAGLASWGLIIFAWLYLENTLYLEPCPLCMMQRVAFALAGAFMILEALFWPTQPLARTFLLLGKYAGIFLGIGLAARHLHIQHLPADQVPACGFDFWTTLDKNGFWGGILKSMQGTGDCAVVDTFWGLSIPLWSMIAFVGLLLIAMIFGNPKQRFPQPRRR